jgi:cytochrome P450
MANGVGWGIRYTLAIVLSTAFGALFGSTDLFRETLLGATGVSASRAAQCIGYTVALAIFWLLAIRLTQELRKRGGRAAALRQLLLPIAALAIVTAAHQVLLLVVEPVVTPAGHHLYNLAFIAAMMLAAGWLVFTVLGKSWLTALSARSGDAVIEARESNRSAATYALAPAVGGTALPAAPVSTAIASMDSQPLSLGVVDVGFDPDELRLSGAREWLARQALTPPLPLLTLLRGLWPIPRLGGWAAVTRYDDVVEVLSLPGIFEVPWSRYIRLLNDGDLDPGTNFLLGIDAQDEHDRVLNRVAPLFTREDVDASVVPLTFRHASEVVAQSSGRVDAIQDLMIAMPLMLCERYYGVTIPDRRSFAQWTMAMSGFLFGPPQANAEALRLAEAAARRVREVVDGAIAQALDRPIGESPATRTVLARFVSAHRNDASFTLKELRAAIMGMIMGFVPTNTMAGGHILEVLLRSREAFEAARGAAAAGDDDLLQRCAFEALRFMPINPGPFRRCSEDYVVAAGTSHASRIPAGTYVLCSTMSAMFDPRRVSEPRKFNPRRAASDYMHFGRGMHWCAGAFIAEAQITQTLKPLLLCRGLRRAAGSAGRLQLLGTFPEHLVVEFDAEGPS